MYRCSACGHDYSQPLPEFPKKIIYLDQCAISNIVKAKDTFWMELHKTLQDLIRRQLIACPYSIIHREESMLSIEWRDKLQHLCNELAGPDRFRSPYDIEKIQLRKALWKYLGKPASSAEADSREEFCEEDPHRFTGDMAVYCHFPANKLIVFYIRQQKESMHEGMKKLGDYRKQNPLSFKEAVVAEIEGYFRSLMEAYREPSKDSKAIENMLSGELLDVYRSKVHPGEFDPKISPSNALYVRLVHHLACEVLKIRPDEHDCVSVVEEFFRSEQAKTVPFLDIRSRLCATILRQTQSARKPRKLESGDTYDWTAVSCYAPYCDAMFLDNEVRELASQRNIDVPGKYTVKPLSTNGKLFSTNNRDKFADYLQEILATEMSQEHRKRLALVYPEWAPLLDQSSD